MRIAILGATSELAKDFVAVTLNQMEDNLLLYARRPQAVHGWLDTIGKAGAAEVYSFDDFPPAREVGALINFVGIGNPAQARLLGTSILELTQVYDDLAIKYVRAHPHCRYVFLSSGAVYGPDFQQPITTQSLAQVSINQLHSEDWYAIAKLYAERRHRAMPDSAIVDLRVFNYFSHTQDMSASYLMADVVRAIASGNYLQTSSANIVRDYLHPTDFHRLVGCILRAPPTNAAVDCYSRAPINKFSLLGAMQTHFNLKYKVVDTTPAGSIKLNYYSLSRMAEQFGYQPSINSLDGILQESEKLFGKCET